MGLLTVIEYSNDIVQVVEKEFTVTIYDGIAAPDTVVIDACQVKSTVNQSIPDTTETVLLWDSDRTDTSEMHSTVANTEFITVLKHGEYLVSVSGVEFEAHANGYDWITVCKEIIDVPLAIEHKPGDAGINNILNLAFIFHGAVGDKLCVFAKQTSGGAINVLHNDNGAFPNFSVILLKDLTGVA